MQFVDSCFIKLKAGNGGDGVVSWRREDGQAMGGPYGGDGGKGGDIWVIGDENVNSLFHLRHTKIIRAENGKNGATKDAQGANGESKTFIVPVGTIIYDNVTNEKLFDITYHKQEFLICKGGKGGFGNTHFKSAINQAPTLYEKGDLGEEKELKLEIQLIANVGLVGLPNAGKSSLLANISNAKPKIASYPFTTLKPVLGTIYFEDFKFVMADIPGVIENASQGIGLGLDFLKHINRCQILLHLIACNDEMDQTYDPIKAFQIIENELKNYSKELLLKPRIIVLTKTDLKYDEKIIEQLITISNKEVYLISVFGKSDLNSLLTKIVELVKRKIKDDSENEVLEINTLPTTNIKWEDIPVEIKKTQYGWQVLHPKLKYWTYKIPQNTIDNRWRLRQKMLSLDLENLLVKAGVQIGDMIDIYGFSFPFQTKIEY